MNEDMVFRMDSIIEIALRDVCLLIFLYMVQRIKLIEVQVNQSIVSADEIISKLRKQSLKNKLTLLLLVTLFVIFNTFKILDYVMKDGREQKTQGIIFTFLSSLLVIDFLITMYIILFQFLQIIHKFLSILKREMEFSLPIARAFLWLTLITMVFSQLTQLFEAFHYL